MKILVCVKQVAVLGDEIEFTPDERDVDHDYLDYQLNEWDAAAVEEALVLRDAHGGEVVAVSVGDADEGVKGLQRALAMGADRAIRIVDTDIPIGDPLATARALSGVVASESPDLVLCGVQSADHLQGATGAALAGYSDLPCVAVVRRLAYDAAARQASVDRELEGGLLATTEVDTPAVLTIQTGINTPRYATLRAIKEAERADIAVVTPEPAPTTARVRRMFVPDRGGGAELLGRDSADVAERIATIIKERLR